MATANTFGIFFYLRRYKESDGTAPIYVRITVDTKRSDIAVKRRIDVANWNGEKGMAKGKSDEIKKLNTYLEQIRSRLVECYQELHLKKHVITSETGKNGQNDPLTPEQNDHPCAGLN